MLTSGQEELLGRYRVVGGVLDFVFLECDQPGEDSSSVGTHRNSVLLALREIQKKADEYAERTAREQLIPKSEIFQVKIDESAAEQLVPTLISWKEFLGSRYDFNRHGLIMHGKPFFPNNFFFFSDPPRKENIIPATEVDDGIGTGFAYTFSDTPYGIRLSASEIGVLFDAFLNSALCVSSNSIIFEWPTNWSNYFDAGKEWWGSFLWSLANPDGRSIIVMAASTTD